MRKPDNKYRGEIDIEKRIWFFVLALAIGFILFILTTCIIGFFFMMMGSMDGLN